MKFDFGNVVDDQTHRSKHSQLPNAPAESEVNPLLGYIDDDVKVAYSNQNTYEDLRVMQS